MVTTRHRLLVALAALAFLVAACGGSSDGGGSDAAGGATSADGGPPAFTAATLAGADLDSASFAGQPTVLWFWAPWCTICRAEASGVVEAAGELGDDVTLLGVAGRGEVPEMEDFVSDTGTDGLTHVVDEDGSIWSGYGVAAQPAFAFISADGEVETVVGAIPEDDLVKRMQALASA
ncbi:MAG: redoxin domain-containing protein [Iamia sp.]